MTPAQQQFYMQQLRRKQLMLESDELRLARLLKQAQDEPTRSRLKRELEHVEIRLRKVKRGILY